jgi:hypothetical protein
MGGDQVIEVTGVMLVGQLLAVTGLYVWLSLALMAVFAKAGAAPWKAWVPVLNLWTLFQIAGMRGWWAVVLAGGGAVVAVVALAVTAVLATAAVNASFEGDTAAASAAMTTAAVVAPVSALVVLVPALILQARMMSGVNRGFGLGIGFTVLGVLVLPVWASIVGWGSARWIGANRPPGATTPRGSVAGPAGVTPPTTAAPIVPALADFASPVSPSPTPFAQPTTPFVAPAVPAAVPTDAASAPVAASLPETTPAPPAGANPWAPPVSAPEAAVRSSATPPPADEEHTVLAAHRHGWTLTLPDGSGIALAGESAVLGRNPVAPVAAPGAQVVAVDDVTRTVSKTHALLRRGSSGWTITDLDSTNGVFLGETPDTATEVAGTAPVSGPFLLGDASFRLAIEQGTAR